MDELLARLRSLDQVEVTFQGGLITWPSTIREKGKKPFQPIVPLWAEAKSGLIHTSGPIAPDEDPIEAIVESLVEFAETLLKACPSRLEVYDEALAEELRQELHLFSVDIVVATKMPAFDEAVKQIIRGEIRSAQSSKGLLDGRGMKLDRIEAFAKAAMAFYNAAPWKFLSDTDFIQIDLPKPPKGMACFTVLGAGRTVFGLGLYQSRNAYQRFLAAGESGNADLELAAGLTQVSFDPLEDLSEVDAAFWEGHDLPVAGPDAYPSVMKYRKGGSASQPTTRELTFLEGLLRALAETTEGDVDAGRWQKTVKTFDGEQVYQLTAPDLLPMPVEENLFAQPAPVTRQASERILGAIQRYFEENPSDNIEEMNEIMQRMFVGRPIEETMTAPRTPAEKAQELCYQAADLYGRQRVKLAREALALDPNCADAYVILGEQAGTLEDQMRFFESAVRAGEATLGPKVFEEDAGHFWGILETRPYMRARLGLAESLMEAGRLDDAIGHMQEMLRLNPNDNQGVRYILIGLLLSENRDADAARLIKSYEEDGSAQWQYAKAILAFHLTGPSMSSERELERAMADNPHVLDLVVSKEPLPPVPSSYSRGSIEEARVVLDELFKAFESADGLLEWLETVHSRRHKQEARRQRAQRQRERDREKKRRRR